MLNFPFLHVQLSILTCDDAVLMFWLGLNIMFWLKIPVLVSENTVEDVLISHYIYLVLLLQTIFPRSP